MQTARKITVQLPGALIEKAKQVTGKGLTPTIRQGLELLAARNTYLKLRQLRGKVKFSIDLNELREDR